MKERDLHELIERQDPEHKQELWEKIKVRIAAEAEPAEASVIPAAPKRRNRFTVILASVLTACLLCLAIVLPVTLTREKDRYCAAGDYVEELLSYNVKEYAARTNKNILYLDWYDFADTVTSLYYNVKDHNDMIFISDVLVDGQTGEMITIVVTDNKTMVDVVNKWSVCNIESKVGNVIVKSKYFLQAILAKFEYNGFRYYIQLDNETDLSRVTQIVEQMLETE